MRNDANFNCALVGTFPAQDQRILFELIRNFRISGEFLPRQGPPSMSIRLEGFIQAVQNNHLLPEALPMLEATHKAGLRFITVLDDDYPEALLQLVDPPFILFILTENKEFVISDSSRNLCVVGSRSATVDAVTLTENMCSKAAASGLTIVSGLASGIDLAAHTGCTKLRLGAKAVAVLGNDAARCFPLQSLRIYREILSQGGAVLSEYPPGTLPMKHQFIARNRIMAGLSRCTVVVQAKEKSGALYTAKTALELGREVCVLPWSLTVRAGKGSNLLLRDGAYPLLSIEDLLMLYPECLPHNRGDVSGQYPESDQQRDEVIKYLSKHSSVSSSELKEKLGLTEVDLIKLELDRVIIRSTTQMVTLV